MQKSPIDTYRNYRRALRSRDLRVILENLADGAAVRLRAFGSDGACGPALRVWCAMQAEAIACAVGIAVNGDRAIVQAGGKHTHCLLHMRRIDGGWRIVAEEHARRCRDRTVFESRSLDLFPAQRDGQQRHKDDRRATICVASIHPATAEA